MSTGAATGPQRVETPRLEAPKTLIIIEEWGVGGDTCVSLASRQSVWGSSSRDPERIMVTFQLQNLL